MEKLYILNKETGEKHLVRKVIFGDAETDVWSNTWYGRHVIGKDCEFCEDGVIVLGTVEGKKRNNSTLSWADCANRLGNDRYAFEDMSNDDLDSIYRFAFDRWAWHLTREGYIEALNKKRAELTV